MAANQKYDFGSFLTNLFGDRYLHSINHSTFNKVGSKAVYRDHFGDLFTAKNSLFVVVGTDSGLLVKYLREEQLASGSRVVFVEFPDLIERLPQVLDLKTLPETISIVSTECWMEKLEELNFTAYVYLQGLQLVESLGAADANIPEYKELYWRLHHQLDHENWRIKAELGSELFLVRQLENLAENRQPALCLKETFAGKTAIVLGGGPSLDESLPWLLEHRDELVIFAVSRISRRLYEVGLVPHLIFSTDPLSVSFEVSKEMLKFSPSTIFVQAYHVCPYLSGQWRGRTLYLGNRLPWVTELNLENFHLCGPTVTNSALSVAIKMGFKQIFLSGFDLCYTKEGVTHAKGSNESETGPRLGAILPTVETNAGNTVFTSQAYFGAMEDLAVQAKEAVAKGCKIINLAAGAARVDYVEYQSLDQLRFIPCEQPPELLLQKLLPEDRLEDRRKDLRQLITELNRVGVALQKIQNLAVEALDCNDGLFGRKGKTANFKYKKRMDKIEHKLNRNYPDLVQLVKQFGIRWFLKTTRPDDEAEWTDEEIEQTGRVYYETYIASSRELGEMIDRAVKGLTLRLEELSEQPDVERLIANWEEEGFFGRAQILLDRPQSTAYPVEVRGRLEKLAADFLADLEKTDAWEKETHFDAVGVKSKALLFYRKRALSDLEELHQSIVDYYQDLESAQQLCCLIEGYIAELKEQPEVALDAYQQLMTEDVHSLTEESLTRIASLSLTLKDSENALLALECLAQISPSHQPNYAALLKLTGNYEAAAEVYGDYLTKSPDDTIIMLKLGQLYLEMNAEEAARTAFRYVLEMDPANSAAKTLLEQLGGDNA